MAQLVNPNAQRKGRFCRLLARFGQAALNFFFLFGFVGTVVCRVDGSK